MNFQHYVTRYSVFYSFQPVFNKKQKSHKVHKVHTKYMFKKCIHMMLQCTLNNIFTSEHVQGNLTDAALNSRKSKSFVQVTPLLGRVSFIKFYINKVLRLSKTLIILGNIFALNHHSKEVNISSTIVNFFKFK